MVNCRHLYFLKIKRNFMRFLRFIMLLSISLLLPSCQDDSSKDLEVISSLLVELEKRDWFRDIFIRVPPPPDCLGDSSSIEKDNINVEDQRLKDWSENYNQQLKEIENRKVDSTYMFLISEDILFNSCSDCSLRTDSLLQNKIYSRYQPLVDRLVNGDLDPILIDYESIPQKGKYKLRSSSEFSNPNQLYGNKLNFLCGGEIRISRFYQEKNLGVLYFFMETCPSNCSAGYLILLEQKSNNWEVFDILTQIIS
jgi:hypothetical protein